MNRNFSSSDFASGFSEETLDTVTSGFIDKNICGEGASCIVYRMRHGDLLVAVKRMRKELLTEPAYRASYRKEFRIGQRLKHDALPVYRNLKDELEEVYIEMDYVDGITVEDFIRTQEGKEYFSSAENVRRFFKELIDVVSYLHRSGVIHSDLKPANIMLRNSDRGVMLLDLDKSYSDILNCNHGGTKSFSEPLDENQKPTAQKDYSAIGRIIESISETISRFPESSIKHFHKECLSGNATPDRLLRQLQSNTHSWIWKSTVLAFLTAGIILTAMKMKDRDSLTLESSEPTVDTISSVTPELPLNDMREQDSGLKSSITLVTQSYTHVIENELQPYQESSMPQSTLNQNETEDSLPTTHEVSQRKFMMPTEEESIKNVPPNVLAMELDIDLEMSEIKEEMRSAIETMREGGMSYEECKQLVSTLSKKEYQSYLRAVEKCKSMYPEIDEEEIETEMTRRMDYSQVSKLFQDMYKTLRQLEKGI